MSAAALGLTDPAMAVNEFTKTVLSFWRGRVRELPSWAKAARIVFAMAPSSAACERVFSLLKAMFGEDQSSALADMLQGSLMLKYNAHRLAYNRHFSDNDDVDNVDFEGAAMVLDRIWSNWASQSGQADL